jgi:Na+/H+ antiporter NhaD/arsenite permease-like protein
MALAPVLARTWWSRHYATVALGLGAVVGGYYLLILHATARTGGTLHEYLSFVTLLGALFVVAGGIHLRVPGPSRPGFNVAFLLFGALLANLLGTTGAAMFLIRPWIRLNQARIKPYHLVFFIFIVANVGGCLTPIGDPPLFLGYLQGIPFWWVAQNCWPMWAMAVGLLLAVFFVLDQRNHARMPSDPRAAGHFGVRRQVAAFKPDDTSSSSKAPAGPVSAATLGGTAAQSPNHWRLEGRFNFFFLAVIVGAVFLDHPAFLREGLMAAAALGSYFTTKTSVHEANGFNFHPLQEVVILFAGIFATMMPALDWLTCQTANLPPPSPGQLYWGAGLLSSVLDNAPTYLAFFRAFVGGNGSDASALLLHHAAGVAAISVGSVFFGAATYLGNGPNFMVKALADEQKIPMPSFFAFVFKYALPWLLPVLAGVWLAFFRA